ncbi:MAG: GNAT family N-acetyltransferase [Pseudotabrizicola sp.]|uniref:GNAT family N-acetyltransferase n=1 Tax=Pseudotabrizicola sp. TaxID=2939647 RepID=UPI00272F5D27|nr:GNAT family N-acetyltransferase [Pseudotabrizicola sp.]MDP2079549.1 GNAT family N-acetyltransferase [Pseudotabrizicola sp.]MDZ7572381.1 GNAT family N-acetyltransferase [Pseudotabrizicola sp.]
MPEAAELAAIHAACFTLPRPWNASEIKALLYSPHVFLLSESGGFLLGRAVAGEAELLTLAVLPTNQRRGIGSRLVQGFLAEAGSRDAKHAFLEVAAGNTPAIALYEQAGFVLAGRRKQYYSAPDGESDDALVLSRAI